MELLKILDNRGECPSVVNTDREEGAKLESNVYDVLAKTSLLQHTINVAVEIMNLFGNSGPYLQKAIVAALAHDLGKIPSYQKKLYSVGDHPLISIGILNQIAAEKRISLSAEEMDEIFRAIKNHHRNSDEFLTLKLKEADQAARRRELAENIAEDAGSDSSEPRVREQHDTEALPTSSSTVTDKTDIFGDKKERIVLKETELSWLDLDEYLSELTPYINRLDGGRWDAFSMRDGYVYIQVKTLWEVAKTIARRNKHADIFLGDADEEFRRNILYSIVQRLKTEKDAIARGLIKDGYFGAPFVVHMRDGTKYTKGFYTPFNAEAFAQTVSELEAKKVGRLKEIVEVTPRFEQEDVK
jgi:hypothetical protein